MALRDFALLTIICLVWASNNIISKLVVTELEVAPLFYAALRFGIVLAVVFPWLRDPPRPLWRLILVSMLMGGGNFALMFIGLKTASPSSSAVVLQLGVPITTVLSMLILGEVVRWRRGIGIAMTVAGALIVMWRPGGLTASHGLLFILGAVFLGSLGAVMMKQIDGVKPLQFQAWVGLTSVVPLTILSAIFEPGAMQHAIAAGWPFLAAVLYSALVVSVVAHTLFYGLIQRYEANLIAPLTQMTPLATIFLGVLITKDHFDLRMAFGATLALVGVVIIAMRPNQVLPLLMALRSRDH
jgi:O-acetylserine/cysteine efflux transporter